MVRTSNGELPPYALGKASSTRFHEDRGQTGAITNDSIVALDDAEFAVAASAVVLPTGGTESARVVVTRPDPAPLDW